MRMSNMMRCPVICSSQVWMYSSANEASENREEDQGDPVEAGQVAGGDVAVDRHLHQVGLRQLQHRVRR